MLLNESARILIADDHKAFGMMVAAVVRAAVTPQVTVVQTVEAAQSQLEHHRPSFLITDLRFGMRFGGLELIKFVRGHSLFSIQTLPILVLSANADFTTVKAARALGVNDFLGKPISPALLVQRLQIMAEAQSRELDLPDIDPDVPGLLAAG